MVQIQNLNFEFVTKIRKLFFHKLLLMTYAPFREREISVIERYRSVNFCFSVART